jgi:predicted transglutaminase-like cysteine proteinase
MSGRIAASGIIVAFLATLVVASAVTEASADGDMTTPAVLAMPHKPTQDQTQQRVPQQAHSSLQSSTTVTAVDSGEPSSTSPSGAAVVIHQSSEAEPFGLPTTTMSAGPFVTMWTIMQSDIRADREVLMRCHEGAECSAAAQNFLAIIADGRKHTGRARIGVVNRSINLTIHPVSENYWITPLETFAMSRGDCKQYAIAKYAALIEAGISENDVRLVIVRDLVNNANHAVVAARLNGDWIVVDNRSMALTQDIEMRGVIPLLVFDRDGVKQFVLADGLS